jgi:hypothetical protein
MLPSTSHAVIRYFVTLKKYDELLRILNDRLNYGIFPDDYCCGLLMDTFIKENNYTGSKRHILEYILCRLLYAGAAIQGTCEMHLIDRRIILEWILEK